MSNGIDWFRWHHGSVTDPKFQLVARKAGASVPDVLAVWAYILESASASATRGSFGTIDTEALDCLFDFPCTETRTADILVALEGRRMIADGAIVEWDKRQTKREREDNTAAERKRLQRERDAISRQSEPCHTTSHHFTPREEKSREDIKPKDTSDQSSDGAAEIVNKPKGGKKRHSTPDDDKAARWMFDQVRAVNPAAKQPNWIVWADEVRMMRELDKRTHHDICELFQWAKHDSFWAPNIQSPAKLRDKWDTLTEQRKRAATPKHGAWRMSDEATAAKGREFGIEARPGETPFAFQARIQAKIDGEPAAPAVRMLAGPPPAEARRPKPAGLGSLSALVGAPKGQQ